MSKWSCILSAVTCLILAGCNLPTDHAGDTDHQDEALEEAIDGGAAFATDSPDVRSGESTVCAAYRERLSELETRMMDARDGDALRGEATTFESLVRHSCQ